MHLPVSFRILDSLHSGMSGDSRRRLDSSGSPRLKIRLIRWLVRCHPSSFPSMVVHFSWSRGGSTSIFRPFCLDWRFFLHEYLSIHNNSDPKWPGFHGLPSLGLIVPQSLGPYGFGSLLGYTHSVYVFGGACQDVHSCAQCVSFCSHKYL